MNNSPQITNDEDSHFTPRCSAAEKERRLRNIYQWLIEGQSNVDIIAMIKQTWNIDERQAKRYIKEGLDLLKAFNQSEIEENRAFHRGIRLEQYRILVKERKALMKRIDIGYKDKMKILASLAHQINMTIRDMAKIDGVFIEKIDHTTQGEKINTSEGYFEINITQSGTTVREDV